jgi:hypothetical protein
MLALLKPMLYSEQDNCPEFPEDFEEYLAYVSQSSACELEVLLSVETHQLAAIGNTRSWEAPGTAGGPQYLSQRSRIWHTT